jgi:uncharacterized repeat protein (TIGR01451 family)
MRFLRTIALAIFTFFVFGMQAQAQTCGIAGWDGPATPSGVINSYHGGSGTATAGSNQVTVASAVGQRTNTRSLRAGDMVLIMQMQDATTPANAGQHGYAMVSSIAGNVLTLNRNLTNTYVQNVTSNLVRTFQVVYVPQYSQLALSGAVTADRWTINTATGVGTGGIVAMDVAGSLSLTGSIDVSGAGFRGGAGINGAGNRVGLFTDADFSFDPANANGAIKGEGTVGTPLRVFDGTANPVNYSALLNQGYALGAGGRAAQGNAGGGGNDALPTTGTNQYNSGGGGGSNAGAGGQGGYSWNIMNDAGGRGATAVVSSITKLVMGGGGGAGSSNNNTAANVVTTWPPTDTATTRALPPATGTTNGSSGVISVSGAPGGGIVLIRTGSLTGNGTINANGYTAFNTDGVSSSEGAGGGGAGGSVVVLAGNGTSGALTINANGGNGGYSNYYDHGPGGGGGGGLIITNFVTGTVNRAGGLNGYDGCCGGTAGNSSPKSYSSTVGTIGAASTAGGTPAGILGGASCLPAITVNKLTLQPTVTAATGATTSYSINLSNTGGAATNVYLFDANLPPGWAYSAAPASTYSYNPAPPGAASSGAETTAAVLPAGLPVNAAISANSASPVSQRAAGASPGVVPITGANSPTFGSFFLAQNGSITVTFAVTIPDTATAGTYHNPAGFVFLDPTRNDAVRMVTAATNANANRTNIAYSGNTTYASGATTNVGGSNYSGLAAGPTTDDVTLLPDLSVTKSTNTPTFTVGGAAQSYIVVGRNNGRAVADQVYATTQATSQLATTIVSSAPTITDTLPSGMTLTALTNSGGPTWACTPNGTSTAFTCSAGATVYPMAAATNLVTVTATVSVSSSACPGPRTNTATITTPTIGDTVPGNNTATIATPIDCNANLTVTKTNGTNTVTAGGTTSYTVTFANVGPAAADGSVARDVPSAGLSCSVASCTATGTGVCPVAGQYPNLLAGGGLTLSSFASGATLSFVVNCNVTATGQ